MRALTVRQPWAWAIIHGGKDVENRTTNVGGAYRGPIAIHAGLTYDTLAYTSSWPEGTARPDPEKRIRGAFVGVVDLVDVHEATADGPDRCCWSPWAEHDWIEVRALCEVEARRIPCTIHLVLANPRPLATPIPARGMLGLWTPPADVLEQLQAVRDRRRAERKAARADA